jgi:single-strand DNA-binding protein
VGTDNQIINRQKKENFMEHINRIELQGRVGTIRTNIVGDNMVANFSLVTEYLYKTRDGGAANETTWHQVTAWEGRDMPDLSTITRGTPVNVTGRLRTFKYTNAEGVEKQLHEVIAYKIRILSEEEAA